MEVGHKLGLAGLALLPRVGPQKWFPPGPGRVRRWLPLAEAPIRIFQILCPGHGHKFRPGRDLTALLVRLEVELPHVFLEAPFVNPIARLLCRTEPFQCREEGGRLGLFLFAFVTLCLQLVGSNEDFPLLFQVKMSFDLFFSVSSA